MAKFKSTAKPASAAENMQSKVEGASRSIIDSAQQIWLAGMGAFARAQQEGGKLFETLVREGSTLEQRTRRLATGQVDAVRGAMESGVGQVRERATDTWDRLEKVFEDRVQRALNGLGVPGREEIESLSKQVTKLTAEVRKLSGTRTATRTTKTAKATRPASPKAPAAVRKAGRTRKATTKRSTRKSAK